MDPFDILSGKIAITDYGIFYFKEPGNNIDKDGYPIEDRLHREGDLPAAIFNSGTKWWCVDGKMHREAGPAFVCGDYMEYWFNNEQVGCSGSTDY